MVDEVHEVSQPQSSTQLTQSRTQEQQPHSPFYVKDCVLVTLALGSKAQTPGELRDRMKTISAESIYYHFWRQSIEASLVPGVYHNDFSNWAHYQLHDDILAERLALMDPSEYGDLEKLRADVIEVIENRLDEQDGMSTISLHTEPFHFIMSKIVVFNTSYKMDHPKDLVKTLPLLSPSSIFYHFIDARRREERLDDFSLWLRSYQNAFLPLIERFMHIDPYFIPLVELQQRLVSAVIEYFLNGEKQE